jgi:hypothetical protein
MLGHPNPPQRKGGYQNKDMIQDNMETRNAVSRLQSPDSNIPFSRADWCLLLGDTWYINSLLELITLVRGEETSTATAGTAIECSFKYMRVNRR